MSGTRHFTVSAVVFNKDEQVLLIHHVKSGWCRAGILMQIESLAEGGHTGGP